MEINLNRGGKAPAPNALVFVPGALLVVIGLFVIWNPQLLVYMVGGTFIALGVLLTLLLLGVRKMASRGLLGQSPWRGMGS
jgi:multisubunit Na+/H+ antiporter MnhC subunit